MKKITGIILFIFLFLPGFSQVYESGLPLMRNYTPEGTSGSQHLSVIQDDRGIMYFGNNQGDIMEYDGERWNKISITNGSFIRSLQKGENGRIYVGGVGDFGHLEPDHTGQMYYVSYIPKLDSADMRFGDIWKIESWKGNIYFYTPRKIYKYLPATDTIQIIIPQDYGFRNGAFCFVMNNRFYQGDAAAGLLELTDDSLKLAPGGEKFANDFVYTMLPYDEDHLFLGTRSNGGFLYNPETGETTNSPFVDKINPLMKSSSYFSGVEYSNDLIVLGAIASGGALVFTKNGEPVHYLNKEAGLNDQTVPYVYSNPKFPGQTPLWLALDIGIAKAELNTPIRIFRENEGFEGNINDIIRYEGVLYLATSSGVYYQSEDNQGRVIFTKTPEINRNSWKFLVFDTGSDRTKKLLVGTETGIFEINRRGKAELIDDKIVNKSDESDLVTYDMFQAPGESKIYLGTDWGFTILRFDKGRWYEDALINLQGEVRSLLVDADGKLLVSTLHNGIYEYEFVETGDTLVKRYTTDDGLPALQETYMYKFDDRVYFATKKGLYKFDKDIQRFVPDSTFGSTFAGGSQRVFRMEKDRDGDIWMSLEKGAEGNTELILKRSDKGYTVNDLPFKRLSKFSTDAFYSDENGIMWFGKSNELFRYDKNFVKDYTIPYHALVRRVTLDSDSVIFGGTYFITDRNGNRIQDLNQPDDLKYSIKYEFNNVTFHWAAPFFEAEEATQYRYWLEGNDKEWTRWSDRTEFTYTNLSRKDYNFHVQARNVYGIESEIGTYEFTILPPWYQTIIAYIVYVILAITLVVIIVKLYTRRLMMENIRLEGIVAERTAEVVRQKEELTDSIEYASRIQRALLPSEKILFETLPKHFILFKPRDIVSGDFYWMTQKEDKIFICAADCTGHGVPGAFMSMLGISFLNEIVVKSGITQSNLILDELREYVMESLKQTGEGEDETKDGMDLSLCVIEKEKRRIQFSGAYNPLYYVRPLTDKEKKIVEKGEELDVPQGDLYNNNYLLTQIRGDKMPIGISAKNHEAFSLNELDMKPGYTLYMFSDGYVDQFGGPEGKKFMAKAFKKLLLEVQDYPMEEQGKILDDTLNEWQGELPQVDDIIVIGIKLD